jgi:uncharacterized damage-inducible protein DinB
MLAGMIGLEEVNPFNKLYWSAIQERDYPGLADVVMEMNRISGKLLNQLATSTDESIFAEEAPGKPALAEIISFFAYHEAYHLGQIGLLRRLLGLSALKSHE